MGTRAAGTGSIGGMQPDALPGVRLSRLVFRAAGIWGVLVLAPQYFAEKIGGPWFPAHLTNPEYFYGFAGVALAWQAAFLVIGSDPARYRGLMPAAVLEKFSFGVAVVALAAYGRVTTTVVGFGLLDLLMGMAFAVCYQSLGGRGQ
jgi:hypothetical protein